MRIVLFAGKGGVGKTTLAAAAAAAWSAQGRKTLVLSTDPAHSLAEVLAVPLSGEPVDVEAGLSASQVDTRALVDGAWPRLRAHLGTLLTGAGVDELSAAELTVLPGLEELLALCEVQRVARSGPWDVVVVDCAATAEALRLLALPEAVGTYLERLFPTHRRLVRGLLGGARVGAAVSREQAERWDEVADALGRLAERLDGLREWLTDPVATGLRLVLTPERVVAAETRRAVTALTLQGIRVEGLLANRMVPAVAASARGAAASWLRTLRGEQEAVLAGLRADLPGLPLQPVEHRASEPVGLAALAELAAPFDPAGDGGPAGPAGSLAPLLAVERGAGTGLDAEYRLRVAVPLVEHAEIELARVSDELAVTVAGHRRLVSLPSVLRRCVLTAAEVDEDGLLVRFRPDPALWMRERE